MLGKGNPHDHFTSRAVETDVTQQAGYLVWQLRSDSTGPDVALDDKDHNWVVVGGESAAHLWISLSLSIFGTKIPKSSIFPEILFFIFFNSSHPVCVVHESPKASRTFPAMWARCICPSFCGGGGATWWPWRIYMEVQPFLPPIKPNQDDLFCDVLL